MSKYTPLHDYLLGITDEISEVTLNIEEFENLLQIDLPESARKKKFWANDRTNSRMQAVAWIRAGWMVKNFSAESKTVVFERELL
jgi:hypothetical protein